MKQYIQPALLLSGMILLLCALIFAQINRDENNAAKHSAQDSTSIKQDSLK